MKPLRTILFILAALVAGSACADPVRIESFEIQVGTAEDPEIWFVYTLSAEIDMEGSLLRFTASSRPQIMLKRASDDSVLVAWSDYRIWFSDVGKVAFIIDSPSRQLTESILAGEDTTYLEPADDIGIVMADGNIFTLTPSDARSSSLARLGMTDRQHQLISAAQAGDQNIYNFKFDLAREIKGADSSETEYAVTYTYRRPTAIPRVGFQSEGRLSNDRRNPLNQLRFLLSANTRFRTVSLAKQEFDGRLFVQAEYSGNQPLDTSSLGLRIGLDAVIPDLIDLTGGVNRVRIKPIIKFDCGYVRRLQRQSLFGGKRDTWELSIDLNYYIPVAHRYALVWQAKGRFCEDIELSDHWVFQQTVMFAYDLPLEDLKALVKWESGRNEFTLDKDSKLLIGLLMDYFPL